MGGLGFDSHSTNSDTQRHRSVAVGPKRCEASTHPSLRERWFNQSSRSHVEGQRDPWDNRSPMQRRSTWSIVLLTMTSACQLFGGVQVTEIATTSGRPSNVAAMVTVTQNDRPISNLSPSAFRLSEDGQVLDNQSVELRLLDPAVAASLHTVLLLDLGHGSTEAERQQLRLAAESFIRSVRVRQSVTVLGFDGAPSTQLIGDFSVDASGAGTERLEKRQVAKLDPSRDLRGSVLEALDVLDNRLGKSPRAIRIGSLVVFSRGPDFAGRVSPSEFKSRLERTKHKMLLVSVTGDPSEAELASSSAYGRIDAEAGGDLSAAFNQAASKVEQLSRSYYLVSYCSPARSGVRRLRIEAQVVNDDLQVETGSVEVQFDSTGFTRGCNSANPPRFQRAKADAK